MATDSQHTIPTSVARKYLTFTFLLTFAILFLAYTGTSLINMITFESPPGRGPRELIYYKYILEDVAPQQRQSFINNLEEHAAEKWMDFVISSEPSGEVLDLDKPIPLPPFSFFPLPPPKDFTFMLSGEPKQYLTIKSTRNIPALFKQRFIINFTILSIAVILAVLITLYYVFHTLKSKMNIADKVIQNLQKGDLKARIPIDTMDEFRETWIRFNTMASEIEALVMNLQTMEQTRKNLLSELAHDLRTPVASLKIALETLQTNSEKVSSEKRGDMLSGAVREIEYFSSLVEDLLFLGLVTEPKYRTTVSEVSLNDLIQDEADAAEDRHPHASYELLIPDKEFIVHGDQKLLHRLFRNVLDNAFAFTNKTVTVKLSPVDHSYCIEVCDDGPGFSEAQLSNFGHKRFSRTDSGAPTKRISVGLGSVIIRSIVEIYRGDIKVSNIKDPLGRIKGAKVALRLPRS